MAFVVDTFTSGGVQVALESHTGETGATWTKNSNYSTGAAVVATSDRLAPNSTNKTSYTASGTASGSDYEITFDYQRNGTISGSPVGGMMGRVNVGSNNAYMGGYDHVNGRWTLYKLVAGTFTILGTYTASTTLNQVYRVTLQIRSGEKALWVDGVKRITSADDTVTGSGLVGFYINGGGVNPPIRLDNLWAADAATSYTMSGPSSGAVSTPSTDFTVALPAGTSAYVTVTPATNGTGTFSPTTVTLTPDAPSATFTFTPSSTGTHTISATNNAGLTNAGNLSYVVGTPGGTITLTAPKTRQVFQRSTSTSGSISIAGTYTGTPTHIEASFNGGSYQTIVSSPSGGTFSGTLTSQTPGQGTLTVRFSNDTATQASVSLVGIGDVFIIAGQSNASGRGTNNQSYTHPSLHASMFGNDYVWKDLADPTDSNTSQTDSVSSDTAAAGSVWPLLATIFMANLNVPVAFVPCALGATAISQWQPGANHQDRTTLYGSMVYRALQTGAKAVLWHQGESDVQAGTSTASYDSSLDTLANAVASDLGVKLMPCKLQHCSDSTTPQAAQDKINTAIATAWGDNTNVVTGPDLTGIDTEDGFHFKTDQKLAAVAQLWWNALSAVYYQLSPGLYTFNGSISGSMNTAGNWTPSGLPTSSDTAVIPSGKTVSSGTCAAVASNSGTISGGTFNAAVTNSGTISGGTFNAAVTSPGSVSGGVFSNGLSFDGSSFLYANPAAPDVAAADTAILPTGYFLKRRH